MALLFMDGFDAESSVSKWDISGFAYSSLTRFGIGKSVYSNNAFMSKSLPPSNKLIVGFAFNPNNGVTYNLLTLYSDLGTVPHIVLRIPSAGVLQLRLNVPDGTLLATAAIPTIGWRYLETSATIADSGGRVIVRLDGAIIIDFTGDTRHTSSNTTIDRITIASITPGVIYFDDVYVCDDTGPTNNTFLGDVRVHTLMPTADTAAADLTPTGSSSHFANVSEIPDSQATYNASGTVGHKDLYAMADLPSGVTTIHAVQANNQARKTDAGSIGLKNIVKSGASTASGATKQLSASVTSTSDVFAVDPATSTAWTVAGVNGVEAGAEVA